MSFFFSPPSPAPPPPAPPLPDPGDKEIAEARRKRRLAEQQRAGRTSTILTGGLGDTASAPVQRPKLRNLLGR